MGAENAEAFLREQGIASTWETVASIKSEVDRLVGADLNAASSLAERVEQLAATLGDPVSKAFAEASRARVLHNSGRHAEASALYDSALGVMRAARLLREGAVIQTHQVYVLTQMGRYDEARRTASSARRALARAEARQLAQLETNIGTIYYRQDRYKKALQHYDRARDLLALNGDAATRAFVDFSRSNILTETDQPDEALALLQSAADAWADSGLNLLAAQAQFHIAYLQFLRGNYHTALTTYYQLRDRLSELGSTILAAWCSQEIGEILLALNAFDDAAESASAARTSFAELGMPYESAQAAMVLALAAMGLERFDEAQRDLRSAREAFDLSGDKLLAAVADMYLAELALRSGQPIEADKRATSAFRVFAGQKLATRKAYSRLLQARACYHAGDLTKAARMAKAALAAVGGIFAPAVVYQGQHLLGRIERDRNHAQTALEFFRRSVETVERMRGGIVADEFKASFLRDKIEAYEDAISACLEGGNEALIEEAFRLVESSKSRALADLLARYVRTTADDPRSPQSETRAKLAKLIEDLNWYSSQAGLEDDKGDQRSAESASRYRRALARCEKQITQLFRRLDEHRSPIGEMQRMRAASVDDLRSTLEPGETLIEYFTTGDR